MTATQFLGAFNDNLFKQFVLFLAVEHASRLGTADIYKSVAAALFALPFVFFSGVAGHLSDRYSKRRIVVLCKAAEIAVMAAGLVVFVWFGADLFLLFVVLGLMGLQSAFFGPSKYGILPELLRPRDLPSANGMIQMTTFLAVIFGAVAAGIGKDLFEDRPWIISLACVAIALLGTATSCLVRHTPVARPKLRLSASSWTIHRDTRELLKRDRTLVGVLLISSLFWFIGAAVQLAVTSFGKNQLFADDPRADTRTGLLVGCLGVGIAIGCLLSARLSAQRIRFGIVTLGGWGLVLGLAATAALGASELGGTTAEWIARGLMVLLGLSAGLFVVPLQVFLQARPPEEQKGRMIGAMNLVNFLAILLAAGFDYGCAVVLPRVSWVFAVLAVLLLPVALFYRPASQELEPGGESEDPRG